jgi:UDP-glucose 4-epimerase
MKVLVTGGRGYLGGRIIDSLRTEGHEAICGTRSRTPCRSNERFTDFEDPGRLRESFKGIDAVVHLAGMNEVEALKDQEAALHTTATYTLRTIQAAKAAGIRRFIYFSTIHVYGVPLRGLIDESTTTRPAHPYSATHRAAEDFVYMGHRDGAMDAVIFRLSNGYGYPMRPGVERWTLLVNDLCKQAAVSGKLILKSSGIQMRDFIPIADVCGAVSNVLSLPRQVDPWFNLGSGKAMSVRDMASYVVARYESVTGNRAVLEVPAPREDESSPAFDFSVEKIRSMGFSPRAVLDEEIDKTIEKCIEWYEKGEL